MLLAKLLSPPSLILLPTMPCSLSFSSSSLLPFPENPAGSPTHSIAAALSCEDGQRQGFSPWHSAVWRILTMTPRRCYNIGTVPVFSEKETEFKGGQVICCEPDPSDLRNFSLKSCAHFVSSCLFFFLKVLCSPGSRSQQVPTVLRQAKQTCWHLAN